MADIIDLLFVLVGIVGGAAVALLLGRRRSPGGDDAARVRIDEMQRSFEEQRRLLERNADARVEEVRRAMMSEQDRLKAEFTALSADALRANNEQFLVLAQQKMGEQFKLTEGNLDKREKVIEGLVKPLSERLAQFDAEIKAMEERRAKAYGSLDENLRRLGEAQASLLKETGTLSNALRNAQTRGRWGELQLRRVAELSGMTAHCDFETQVVIRDGEGDPLRPDMVVHYAGGRMLFVDAKAPLAGYLESLEATTPEAREEALDRHAAAVRGHIKTLRERAYWESVEGAADFVVMFVPVEPALSAAFQKNPTLFEEAAAARVLLATPMTLIAMLRAAEIGWHEKRVTESAAEVRDLGRELYTRLAKFTNDLEGVGKGLDKAVKAYNDGVGSYEGRVLPQARRFRDLGVAGTAEIETPEVVERTPRILVSPEAAESRTASQ